MPSPKNDQRAGGQEPADDSLLPVGKLPGDLLASLVTGLANADPDVLVGPGVGRDAAAIRVGETILVFKNDPITFVTEDAPVYLVSVNANDLACLGATPRWLLVTALLPSGATTTASVISMFEQLRTACDERGIALIGGHTEITAGLERPILVGTMVGTAEESRLIRPGRAKPGDRIILAGSAAIEGTALLAKERAPELIEHLGEEVVARAQTLLIDPGISVTRAADVILSVGGVTALHDPTEGGIATGIRELAIAAGHGAVVRREQIPILPETAAIADYFGIDPLGMLASGSLLASVAPDSVTAVLDACQDAGLPCHVIGKIAPSEAGFSLHDSHGAGPLPSFVTDEVSRALASSPSIQPQ